MTHDVDAIYDHGVFRPIGPVVLSDGTRVHLRVEEGNGAEKVVNDAEDGKIPTLLERMKDFVGTVHDLPPDASANLDHYLYGTPNRQ
jgi:predicted DNA-binding antitoxin AbrB/MazE fold protein